ncbi:hypothetical protein N9891_02050 [bacterium]|nr:hypothetical protein [bacterium]
MKPIRVYYDRVNLVIALGKDGGVENGIYLYRTISSYLPGIDKDDRNGFEFGKAIGSIYP